MGEITVNRQLGASGALAALGKTQNKTWVVAETGRRVWAYFIDESIRALIFLPAFFAKDIFATVAMCWFLHYAFRAMLLYLFQTSPGKAWVGLRVRSAAEVRFNSTRKETDEFAIGMLPLSSCFIRPLSDDLSIFFGLIPRIWAVVRFDRRHLSDLLAETQVVQSTPRAQFPKRRWGLFWVVFLISVPSIGSEALELFARF